MGLACGDVDGDGRPDLAVTNFYNEYTTLYQNRGGGVFNDATAALGIAVPTKHRLGFGVALLDVNNDGRLDLATANGHVDDFRPALPYAMTAQLLLGVGAGRMVDATAGAGSPWKIPRVARGLAAGDLDNDGRIDLLILSHDVPLAYFHNRTAGRSWLTLGLEATAGHREAIGARVVVTAGERRYTAWRVGGGSFQSSCDPRSPLRSSRGSEKIETIEVTWPSGKVDRFGPLAAGVGYLLREGDPAVLPLPGFVQPARAARCGGGFVFVPSLYRGRQEDRFMRLDRSRTAALGLALAIMIGAATAGSGCGGPTEGSQAKVPEEVQKKTENMLNNMQKDMATKYKGAPKGKAPPRTP